MKHRDAYTLEGGKNMQQTSLGRVVRCLMAVLVLVTSLALLACPSDDEDIIPGIDATVPVSSTTVAAVQAQTLTFGNGSAFGAAVGANPATLTFNTPGTFTLTRTGGATATGTARFASCTLTVTGPASGGLFPVGTVLSFPTTCNFRVRADNVEVDGATVTGTLTLILVNAAIAGPAGTSTSNSISVQVFVNADRILIINTVITNVDLDVTGTTGG